MEKAKIENISFDEEDAKLFKLQGDLLLKAKGIKYSFIPKLNVLLEEALTRIRKIYGIEVFNEKSIVRSWPSFRDNRENNLKVDYHSAYIGITGSRIPIWNGFKRKDGKPVKIIPYSLGFQFHESGITLLFNSNYNLALTDESFKKYFDFLHEKLSLIQSIQSISGMNPSFYYNVLSEKIIIPFDEILNKIVQSKNNTLNYYRTIRFPLEAEEFNEIVNSFVLFYPIYDSIIRIAKNEDHIFDKLISLIKLEDINNENYQNKNLKSDLSNIEMNSILSRTVDNKNIVKAGIRWQVFERDDFKCVACGTSANEGAILHVDHILPRSKGGKDIMDNYQTLCHVCNIGKSNKSNKNLRIVETKI